MESEEGKDDFVKLSLQVAYEYFSDLTQELKPLSMNKDVTFFPVELQRTKKSYKFLDDGTLIILGGDSLATTHFFTGTGVNLAFEHAHEITDHMSKRYYQDELHSLNNLLMNSVKEMHLKSAGGIGSPPDAKGRSCFVHLRQKYFKGLSEGAYANAQFLMP